MIAIYKVVTQSHHQDLRQAHGGYQRAKSPLFLLFYSKRDRRFERDRTDLAVGDAHRGHASLMLFRQEFNHRWRVGRKTHHDHRILQFDIARLLSEHPAHAIH